MKHELPSVPSAAAFLSALYNPGSQVCWLAQAVHIDHPTRSAFAQQLLGTMTTKACGTFGASTGGLPVARHTYSFSMLSKSSATLAVVHAAGNTRSGAGGGSNPASDVVDSG